MNDHDLSQVVYPTRYRNGNYYLVLLFLVTPVWASVPLSWAFVFYSLHHQRLWSYSLLGQASFAWALIEVIFSIYHQHLVERISGPSPCGPGNLKELQAAFQRVLKAGLAPHPDQQESATTASGNTIVSGHIEPLDYNDPRAADFRHTLRTWFGRVPWSDIRRTEVYAWLYWSIFNADLPPLDEIPPAHMTVLKDAIDLMHKRTGTLTPEGSAPHIKPMRLTLDKVNVAWRPFLSYVVIWAVNRVVKSRFERSFGAEYGSFQNIEYLIRTPRAWNKLTDPRPIVFIHGLGVGLLQYELLIAHLLETFTDRPILIPLQPQISQDLFHPQYLKPMSRHEMADRLAALLVQLGWADDVKENIGREDTESGVVDEKKERTGGVTMVSHSNGSYTHAWMLKGHPKMISRSCFVDPVTFCLWEGDVCYNFMYRPCRTGMELLMAYFVGMEVGVANLLQRHFDWSSNALFFEDIPNARDPSKTMILLGGKDDIVNADRVVRYLQSHGIRKGLWLDPTGRHGQALISGTKGHQKILSWLREDL